MRLKSAEASLTRGDEIEKQVQSQVASESMAKWSDWAVANRLRREAADKLAEKPAVDAKSAKRE